MKSKYSEKDYKQEQEANIFACCLLMPKSKFIPKWKHLRETISDDDKVIIQLAKTFEVPLFAVVMRIRMLSAEDIKQLNS